MLDDTTSKDDHTWLFGLQGTIVQPSDIFDEINDEAFFSPWLEVDDITKGAISEGRAIDWNIVLLAPVVDAVWVVDLLADTSDNHGRGEDGAILLLFFVHLNDKGLEPAL